jgi:hypothetical protein
MLHFRNKCYVFVTYTIRNVFLAKKNQKKVAISEKITLSFVFCLEKRVWTIFQSRFLNYLMRLYYLTILHTWLSFVNSLSPASGAIRDARLSLDRLDDPIAFVAGNDCDIPEDIQHLLLSTRRALLLLDDYSQRAARQEMHVRFR